MGIEIILFSLLYLPASEELNIAFSTVKKKKERKLQASLTVEGPEGCVEKRILRPKHLCVFTHKSVSDYFSQYRETANSILC